MRADECVFCGPSVYPVTHLTRISQCSLPTEIHSIHSIHSIDDLMIDASSGKGGVCVRVDFGCLGPDETY